MLAQLKVPKPLLTPLGRSMSNRSAPRSPNSRYFCIFTMSGVCFTKSQLRTLFGAKWKPEALKGYEWTRGGVYPVSVKVRNSIDR